MTVMQCMCFVCSCTVAQTYSVTCKLNLRWLLPQNLIIWLPSCVTTLTGLTCSTCCHTNVRSRLLMRKSGTAACSFVWFTKSLASHLVGMSPCFQGQHMGLVGRCRSTRKKNKSCMNIWRRHSTNSPRPGSIAFPARASSITAAS